MSSEDSSEGDFCADTGDFSVASRLESQFFSAMKIPIDSTINGKQNIIQFLKDISTINIDSKESGTGVDGN